MSTPRPCQFPMTRRDFTRLSLASIPLFMFSPRLLAQSSASRLLPAGIAGSVAKSIGTGILSAAGGAMFNQALGFMGVDLSGNVEINGKLNQILQDLHQLQGTVSKMREEMNRQLADLSYDVNVKPVQELMNTNRTILDRLKIRARLEDPDEQQSTDDEIAQLINGRLQSAVATWHDALTGESGQTGLIKTINRAAWAHYAPSFGPTNSSAATGPRRVQQSWDLFDAHQALSVNFLVAALLGEQPEVAQSTYLQWLDNRRTQLSLLRGCVRRRETLFLCNGESDQLVRETIDLNALPPNTLLVQQAGYWRMWYAKVGTPIKQPADRVDVSTRIAEAKNDTGVTDGWRLTSVQEMIDLVDAVPAMPRMHEDHFQGNLIKLGFEGLNSNFNFWTADILGVTFGAVRVVFREGQNWHKGTINDDWRGIALLCRNVSPKEMERYLYLE